MIKCVTNAAPRAAAAASLLNQWRHCCCCCRSSSSGSSGTTELCAPQIRPGCRGNSSKRRQLSLTTTTTTTGAVAAAGSGSTVLFFGTDSFGLATLKQLHLRLQASDGNHLWRPMKLGVVSGARTAVSPVELYARAHALTVLPWSPAVDVAGYDLAVIASFGHLIPKRIIDAFDGRVYNVHASLLPRWRGATPVVHTILAGDAVCGVTIMKVAPHRFDEGDVLAQRALAVPELCDVTALTSLLAEAGSRLMLQCLEQMAVAGLSARRQTTCGITYAPLLSLAQLTTVDWLRPCRVLLRQHRSLTPPLALETHWQGKRVRLRQLHPLPIPTQTVTAAAAAGVSGSAEWQQLPQPGQLLLWQRRQLLVSCGDGWLQLLQLQLAGKRCMSGADFYNGFLSRHLHRQRCFDSLH